MEYKEIRVRCMKGEGTPVGQFLRQLALTRLTSWRPIGFRLCKDNTNVLHSSGDIIPSMIDLANTLSLMRFVSDREDNSAIEETYTFNKVLNSEDMQGNSIKCITKSKQVLTSISNETITLKVYYRYGYGKYSTSQNLVFLQSTGKYRNDVKVIPSMHSPIDAFSFKTEEVNLDEEDLVFKISANTNNELELLLEVVNIGIGRLNDIKSNF